MLACSLFYVFFKKEKGKHAYFGGLVSVLGSVRSTPTDTYALFFLGVAFSNEPFDQARRAASRCTKLRKFWLKGSNSTKRPFFWFI